MHTRSLAANSSLNSGSNAKGLHKGKQGEISLNENKHYRYLKSRYRTRSRSRPMLRPKYLPNKRRKTVIKSRSIALRRKNRTPTYALTIMGKILYRRLRRSSLVTKGVNLVRRISSCSSLGWSSRLLSPAIDATKNSYRDMSSKEGGKLGLPPATANDRTSDCISWLHQKSPDRGDSRQTVDLNSNVNARTVSGTRQDSKQNVSSRSGQAMKASSHYPNSASRQKLRRVLRYRGLVARSIGKPKVRERMRAEGKGKGKRIHSLGNKKKRKTQSMLVKSLRTRIVRPESVIGGDATTVVEPDQGMSVSFPKEANSFDGTCTQVLSKTESSKGKTDEALGPQRDARSCAAVSSVAKRKSRKWKTLMRLGNTVLAGHTSAQTSKKKRLDRRTVEQKASSSNVIPSYDRTKNISSDNSEWPSLAVSGRTRAHAKETATEIVRSKHSASATKTTRKGWADIVSRRSKEPVCAGNSSQPFKDKRKAEAGPAAAEKKTWASVAAAGMSKCETAEEKTHASVKKAEQCGEPAMPSDSGNLKKKRRKADFSLAYTDRIWLTCQKSKGNSHVQNFCRKHFGDRKEKISKRKCNLASPRKKICCEKRRERNQQERQISDKDSVSVSLASTSRVRQGTNMQCTSSNRDSQGQNACLVDNMPEVYTKKAGMVITLNESSHDRSTHKNVNKCNNRMNRARHCRSPTRGMMIAASDNSAGPSDDSGTDLCSQLSSMTFQTPTESCCTFRRSSSVPSGTSRTLNGTNKQSQPARQHNAPRASLVEAGPTKQKKVSLRYRALLRDGCGPLDARAVSDIHTRHRRADTLQDSKVATRARRRRHRMEQQSTTHISRRVPAASSAKIDSRQPSWPKPESSGQPEQAEYGKPGLRNTRLSSTRKTSATPQEEDDSLGASSSLNAGQIKNASSSTSSDGDVAWRPADNKGTNNSRRPCECDESGCPINTRLTSLRKHSCASVLGPVLANSAPQLSERHNSMRLELGSNLHTLDMNWWNAYLQQPNDL